MENAVEALKLFFGVTIFALALTVFFRMTSLAKDTADIVFSSIDKTTLINYTADVTDGDKRTVSFQEIMPTIYRYAQEGYGVTIIDRGEIVARFDLDTESQVSSCFWNDTRYDKASDTEKERSNKIKYEIGKYLNENIYKTIGLDRNQITLPSEENKSTSNNYGELDSIIKRIYGTGDVNNPVYTGWLKSNTYSNNYITQRINSDIYGQKAYFSLSNPGVNDSTLSDLDGIHEPVCIGGLLEIYKNKNFKEYIVQIDSNEYVTDENGENTGLLVYGTIRYTKKREIIYVKQ